MRYKTPDELHTGWPNRETWVVSLALARDEPTAVAYRIIARGAIDDSDAADIIELAFRREQMAGPNGPLRGYAIDLLNCALMRVDWGALARRLRAA